MLLSAYYFIMRFSATPLHTLLRRRMRDGKEDPERLTERKGIAGQDRPQIKRLGYIHAASVGEAQSALILIERLLSHDPALHVLITTGTRSSAGFIAKKLPQRAIHQYVPLDNPYWVKRFLEYWRPDFALWMESELWPNMLRALHQRKIPIALVNARMSDASFKRWHFFKNSAQHVLSCFDLILAQTENDQQHYKALGHSNVVVTDNLKYSAAPLPYSEEALSALQGNIKGRPLWVYASTHAGEEEIACRTHMRLKAQFPNLLTIIVPRHPERRHEIKVACAHVSATLSLQLRSLDKDSPIAPTTDIYIADSFGELGLFYALSPIAMIGRSLSNDGGGGHNPIEAAQLGCAVVFGEHVKYQQDIYDDMLAHKAALCVQDETALVTQLETLLKQQKILQDCQAAALEFSNKKSGVIETVWQHLLPVINEKGRV